MHNNRDVRSEQAEPLALLHALAANRTLLWRFPLVVTVVVTAIAFLFPNVYRSRVTVLPPERDFQSMSMPTTELQGLFAGGMDLPLMATPSDILAAVVMSETTRDSLNVRLGLQNRWHLSRDKVITRLQHSTGTDVAPTGVVTVWADESNRRFADTLVNELVAAADRINQAIVNTKASRTRRFVEQRLAENRQALDSATAELERFQNAHQTVALDAEIAAMVANAAQLRAQLTADEIQLSVLEGTLSSSHPEVRALRSRIRQTQERLARSEQAASADSTSGYLGAGLSQLPRVSQELATRLRDVKVAETLYELLVEQYEHARIQERRDTPTFSVLDWAVSGGSKVRPRRSLVALASLVLSFGMAVAFVLARTYMACLARTDPARHESLVALWETVRPRRRNGSRKVAR